MMMMMVGSEAYSKQYMLDIYERKCKPVMAQLRTLNHPLAVWRAWQSLNMTAGLTHHFRTTPPPLIASAFPQIEADIRSFLGETIFGKNLTDLEWSIVQLPFLAAGIGRHSLFSLRPVTCPPFWLKKTPSLLSIALPELSSTRRLAQQLHNFNKLTQVLGCLCSSRRHQWPTSSRPR